MSVVYHLPLGIRNCRPDQDIPSSPRPLSSQACLAVDSLSSEAVAAVLAVVERLVPEAPHRTEVGIEVATEDGAVPVTETLVALDPAPALVPYLGVFAVAEELEESLHRRVIRDLL